MQPCGCPDPEVLGCQCSFEDSNTIAWAGSGSPGDPKVASVIIDPDPENTLEETANGLLNNPLGATFRCLGGKHADGPSPAWDLTTNTYQDWGGNDFTKKTYTKLGSAAETDLVILFQVTAYLLDTGQAGSCLVEVGMDVGGADFGSRPFGLTWSTVLASQSVGEGLFTHYSGYVAAGGIASGAVDIQLRGRIAESDHQVRVNNNSGYHILVFEVPATLTFT